MVGLDYPAVVAEAERLGIDYSPCMAKKIKALERTYLRQVADDNDPGTNNGFPFIAYFRYENDNDHIVYVPHSPEDNYITGAEGAFDDINLPEKFYTDANPEFHTFGIPFDGSTIVWTLKSYHSNLKSSSTSSANSDAGKCNKMESARIGDSTIETTDAELSSDKFTMQPGSIILYPNPATEKFIIGIVGEQKSIMSINLFDSQGKYHDVKASWNPSVNGMEIDISDLKYGVYLIKINVNNEDKIIRFIKE